MKLFGQFVLALGLLTILSACGAVVLPLNPEDNIRPIPEKQIDIAKLPEADSTISGEILEIKDNRILICGTGEQSEASMLYFVDMTDAPIFGIDNSSCDNSDLKLSQTVQIGISSGIDETFPAQIGNADYIKICADGSALLPMYMQAIDYIFEQDSALNSNIDTVAIDLSGIDNLSEAQKSGLIYLCGQKYSLYAIPATQEQLIDMGYIDPDAQTFENGILIKISASETSDESFSFEISKWKANLAAVGTECSAKLTDGVWQFEPSDNMWIS